MMRLGSLRGLFEGKRRTSVSQERVTPTTGRKGADDDAARKDERPNSSKSSNAVEVSSAVASSAVPSMPLSASASTGPMQPITPLDLDITLHELAKGVKPWATAGSVTFIKTLQDAVRNHGRVDLMEVEGKKVAVKRMPNRWMRAGPKEFREQYPTASERPWHDLGFVKHLNMRGVPYSCNLMGLFRDDSHAYVLTSLATEGDLFGWCDCEPKPGKEREEVMMPLVLQIITGVRWIHSVGIAHRDISLENILLTRDEQGRLQVKLIDFGMGTLKRWCTNELRGKQSYQAPEMHRDEQYDAFLTDTFALGVVIFAMAVQDYPWVSTKRSTCQLFEYVAAFGLLKLLERRKLRKGNGERLVEVMSENISVLLKGMLEVQAEERTVLGEPCWDGADRNTVWDTKWLKGRRADVDPFPLTS